MVLDIDRWWSKFLHFALHQLIDWRLVHQIFLKLFAMDLSGQMIPSIHRWQYFGQDLLMHMMYRIGTRPVFGGKDGHLLTHQFSRFHLMDQLILDKIFNTCLEIAIGSLQLLLVPNSHFWSRTLFKHKQKIMLQFML